MTDNQTEDGVLRRRYGWEFFISHVKNDTGLAQRLKAELDPPASVFLDVEHIAASDQWRAVLSDALRSSLVYVFLVPKKWETYTWQDEEMTIADHLYRTNQETRRIFPIYLDRDSVPPADQVPFGLARFPGLALPDPSDLARASEELRRTLGRIKPIEVRRIEREDVAREAAAHVTHGGVRGLVTALESMPFMKPLFSALVGLIVLTTLAVIGCAVASIWTIAAYRALVILGVLWALLVVLLLGLLSTVLRTMVEVNRRGIKGG